MHEAPPLYAVRATDLRSRARLGPATAGFSRCASSNGLISAAGFGALNR